MPILKKSLGTLGPIVSVGVGVSDYKLQALKAANLNAPSLVIADALIDTGADCTVISKSIVEKLGLERTGSTAIVTPSTPIPHECGQYDVSLVIFMDRPDIHVVSLTMPVIEAETSFDALPYQVLIGRDVLSRGILTYDGQAGQLTLAF